MGIAFQNTLFEKLNPPHRLATADKVFQNFVPTLATLEPTRFSAQLQPVKLQQAPAYRQARDRFRSAGAAKPAGMMFCFNFQEQMKAS